MLSRTNWQTVFCLLWLCLPAWAESLPDQTQRQAQKDDICYFYAFIKGTKDNSDPANQVSHFIKNRWIELENDLARGHGEELNYLNGLARCPYTLPEKFWETHLKGLPYEQRAKSFTQAFISTCFCEWK
jgi:hypothetical protein